jgi:hypothetical protein
MKTSHWPVERGFRLRGQQVMRLEPVVDAACAFSPDLLALIDPAIGVFIRSRGRRRPGAAA